MGRFYSSHRIGEGLNIHSDEHSLDLDVIVSRIDGTKSKRDITVDLYKDREFMMMVDLSEQSEPIGLGHGIIFGIKSKEELKRSRYDSRAVMLYYKAPDTFQFTLIKMS